MTVSGCASGTGSFLKCNCIKLTAAFKPSAAASNSTTTITNAGCLNARPTA
jgi:hypothetical protein